MEVLGHKIQTAVSEGWWRPCRPSRQGPPLSHLFFADDLLLFGDASFHQAETMRRVLADFCHVSGQKMNIGKSKVWLTPNVPLSVGKILLRRFGVPLTRDLGKYLGVPLLQGSPRRHHFQFLVDRV